MRRLATMAAIGVVLAGPAWAGGVTADCSQAVAKLSLAQIEYCREQEKAFRDLVEMFKEPVKDSGVIVTRGSGVRH